jgi:hypothetical protein
MSRAMTRTIGPTERHCRVVYIPASYSEVSRLKPLPGTRLPDIYRGFPQTLQVNAGIVP